MELGRIDYYVLKPWQSPDELFHSTISGLLHEWQRWRPSALKQVCVVGERDSPRSHEVRDILERNDISHVYFYSNSEDGRKLLAMTESTSARLPVVVMLDGQVLADPSNAELAEAYGVSAQLKHGVFDTIIIGAGPAGLATAVYSASEGLSTLVVEKEAVGGKPAPALLSATTSASRAGSAGEISPFELSGRVGYSERVSSLAKPWHCVVKDRTSTPPSRTERRWRAIL
jgi:thioredoxin reductase (NADPH)